MSNQHARLFAGDLLLFPYLSSSERLAYLALCFSCRLEQEHERRIGYPSQAHLAGLMGISVTSIRRGLRDLRKRGILTARQSYNSSSSYILEFPKEHHYLMPDGPAVGQSEDLGECSHVGLSDGPALELSDGPAVELSDSPACGQLTNQLTNSLTNLGSEEPNKIFELIYNFFSQHELTRWNSDLPPLFEFYRVSESSSLNVERELLHVAAYNLEMIAQFEEEGGKRKFWTGTFWVAGLSQWLGRERKSTLDMKRSLWIEKVEHLIPELKPPELSREREESKIPNSY
jgi:hypothetical protein